MLKLIFTLIIATFVEIFAKESGSVADQIMHFKEKHKDPIGIMTTSAGAPIEKKDTESTLNIDLLTNEFFLDGLTHFVRERRPVRPVHPKGAGASGYFKATKNMSHICKAEFLNAVGKITPIACRLSMGATERGGSDLTREPRGFSCKLYTKEGNLDIAGFNTPIFTVKDPALFTPFGHVMRKNPATDLLDVNMVWDYIILHPESLFIFMYVFSDEGIPHCYRNMPGYSIHTYPLYNAEGKITYGRFHFVPVNGIKYLNTTEAATLGAKNPDYCAQDLYQAIYNGSFPTWNVYLQLISDEQRKKSTIDIFDVTLLLPKTQFPLTKIGEIVLNKAPKNYYSEVEQIAFCPANLVPGVLGSPDATFRARRFSYRDSERYRLGSNFDNIPINYPYRSKVLSYNRDGAPPNSDNGYNVPNYYPNSFNGPVPYVDKNRPSVPKIHEKKANNLAQIRDYYTEIIVGEQGTRLIDNICDSLCGTVRFLQDEALLLFETVHHDLAERVAKRMKERDCRH